MPLIRRDGSRTPSTTETPEQDGDHRLAQVPFVQKTEIQKSAFSPKEYPIENKAIQGYIQGHRVTVSYYHKRHNASDYRNTVADTSSVRGTIHDQYHLIQNFEITLEEGFSLDYDASKTESNVQGRAVLYPGINPTHGDLFIYNMGDGNMGLFSVTEITPLTWRNTRPHSIAFYLHSFVDDEIFARLEESTVQTTYFDKQTFLGDDSTLLLQDDYVNLLTLRDKKTVLSQLFFRNFYNKSMATIMDPDGVYDPYLLQFILMKIPFKMTQLRPRQLLSVEADYMENVLWGRLLDPLLSTVDGLWSKKYKQIYHVNHRDTQITTLANRPYYFVRDNACETENCLGPYVLSEAFYTQDIPAMTNLEYMVYIAIIEKRIPDVSVLLTMVKNLTMDSYQSFYYIPLYIHLIDVAITSFEKPKKQTRGIL